MIGTVLTDFTRTVSLQHFFVPLEVLPRTMTTSMVRFDCHGNPVNGHFCPNLTANATCANFDQLTA
jgi:hypothetical protein